MGDVIGVFDRILSVLVPNKRQRGVVWIFIALLAVAAGGVYGYTAIISADNARIDSHVQAKVHPVRVKMYENGALTRHVFEHLENQLPAAQRHSIDEVRREGHNELLEDEKLEAAAKTKEGGD